MNCGLSARTPDEIAQGEQHILRCQLAAEPAFIKVPDLLDSVDQRAFPFHVVSSRPHTGAHPHSALSAVEGGITAYQFGELF